MNKKIAAGLASIGCLLAGCAHRPWLYVDDSRASVLIVRGYIGSGALHRSSCYEPVAEAICGTGLRSDVTFVIEQTLVGDSAGKRVPVQFQYTDSWPELARGRGAQYLAVILTDGEVSELHGVASVARTIDGRWAIPIATEDDEPTFPCSRAEIPPARLQFQPRGPRASFAANEGLLLDHAVAVYGGKTAAEVEGACRY